MKFGLIDIVAAGVSLFAVLLPSRSQPIDPVYPGTGQIVRAIAADQADVSRRPDDAVALQRLVETLLEAGQSDWALRVAGAGTARVPSADRWRALLATSEVHADRLEIKQALEWATKAVAACQEAPAGCPVHEGVRLTTYEQILRAGVNS